MNIFSLICTVFVLDTYVAGQGGPFTFGPGRRMFGPGFGPGFGGGLEFGPTFRGGIGGPFGGGPFGGGPFGGGPFGGGDFTFGVPPGATFEGPPTGGAPDFDQIRQQNGQMPVFGGAGINRTDGTRASDGWDGSPTTVGEIPTGSGSVKAGSRSVGQADIGPIEITQVQDITRQTVRQIVNTAANLTLVPITHPAQLSQHNPVMPNSITRVFMVDRSINSQNPPSSRLNSQRLHSFPSANNPRQDTGRTTSQLMGQLGLRIEPQSAPLPTVIVKPSSSDMVPHISSEMTAGVGGVFGAGGGGATSGAGDTTQFADPVTGRPMQVIPTDVATAVRQARTAGRFGGDGGFTGGQFTGGQFTGGQFAGGQFAGGPGGPGRPGGPGPGFGPRGGFRPAPGFGPGPGFGPAGRPPTTGFSPRGGFGGPGVPAGFRPQGGFGQGGGGFDGGFRPTGGFGQGVGFDATGGGTGAGGQGFMSGPPSGQDPGLDNAIRIRIPANGGQPVVTRNGISQPLPSGMSLNDLGISLDGPFGSQGQPNVLPPPQQSFTSQVSSQGTSSVSSSSSSGGGSGNVGGGTGGPDLVVLQMEDLRDPNNLPAIIRTLSNIAGVQPDTFSGNNVNVNI